MEAGLSARRSALWLVLAFALLLRLPFLHQAIQGDEPAYLNEAAHALVDPLHPDHTTYIFRGVPVDQRGLSHPPMNAWILAGLLAIFGGVKEVPFHAAYSVFSLIAAAAMWSLARRFSPQPLWAALLFLAVPVFVVNGNSLETDVPFLAFWMAAVACFCANRLGLSAAAMALAALTSYQSVFLTPILAVFVWLFDRRNTRRWLTLLAAPLTIAAWQVYERSTTGAMPAAVLAGYFRSYGFQAMQAKISNALALTVHSWFLLCPALLAPALVLAWGRRREKDTHFLLAWLAIFFAGAVAVFFAGSARYLLPMAAPLALLASRLRPRWLAPAVLFQLVLGLGLAIVNYQQWGSIREYAASLRPALTNSRVWVDDEWGLRQYLQELGARPLAKSQILHPGDIVVAGELSHAVEITAPTIPVAQPWTIQPRTPLRIVGLETRSGYSSAAIDRLWPFGLSAGVIDRITAFRIAERHPALSSLDFSAPATKDQIVSGIWPDDRWMSGSAVVALKTPPAAARLAVRYYRPENAAAGHITLLLDGREVASQSIPGAGASELVTADSIAPGGPTSLVEVRVDRTFSAPPDVRQLGVVLTFVGFTK